MSLDSLSVRVRRWLLVAAALLFIVAIALPAFDHDTATSRYLPFVFLAAICGQYVVCRLLARAALIGVLTIQPSDPLGRKLAVDATAVIGFGFALFGLLSRVPL